MLNADDVLIRNNVKLIGKGSKTLFLAHGFGCDLNHVNEGLEFYIEEKLVSI